LNEREQEKLYTMTNGSSSKPSRPESKGSLAAFKGLFPFLRPYRRQFALAGIALVFAAGATLAIPYAFKQMIDLGFGASAAARSMPPSSPCSAWPRCWR
jgi:ATP-binding cassette subfamily B protein